MGRIYACIDLKSFYASVECKERGLDPITTNLVVADSSRTEKTICLAVSPSLKAYGLPGRARLFEVVQKVKEINYKRKKNAPYHRFKDKSYDSTYLNKHKETELDYIVATPRMSYYIKYSTRIYNVYLKYLSCDDIYVYSIDEIFCDITDYINYYKLSPKDLITKIITDVYETTGITATGGIGTNPYLAKVAMDVVAKHIEPDKNGVRIATLDVMKYRKLLWEHTPITDFWRVGKGYGKTLEENNIYTMGDVALTSIENEELLYRLFGVNAELLIDHAWGYEPCTISDIKVFKPKANCLTSGQVLHCAYDAKKAKIVVKEMAESLALDLVKKGYVTSKIVLTIGYDISSLTEDYKGEIMEDRYGRNIPKHAHGTINLDHKTSSTKLIQEATSKLYDRIINNNLLVKRINIAVVNLSTNTNIEESKVYEQFDLFSNYEEIDSKRKKEKEDETNERKIQEVIIDLKQKYGKNSILKGLDLVSGATAKDRNSQIGGHRE